MIRNPIPWPGGAKCAVAITFDMDADSLIHIAWPEDGVDRLYETALDQVRHNLDFVRPGMEFVEFNERSWRIPDRHMPYCYTLAVHGVGMAGMRGAGQGRRPMRDSPASGRRRNGERCRTIPIIIACDKCP